MIKTSIEKIASEIGFDIANSDDNVQSDLFNGLARGFRLMQDSNREMQFVYLTDKLTPDACKMILDISEFIKLKNQQ